jgi:hypothetical protein
VPVEIEVWQHVASSVPGRVGNWAYSKVMQVAAVPRADESIILLDEISVSVKYAAFVEDCRRPVHVELVAITTDNPEILDWLDKLVAREGWQQWGGPWAVQT